MKIVLNFLPLKSGGGLQVGLDFVRQAQRRGDKHDWFLVATEGTPLAQTVGTKNVHVAAIVPRNLPARLWFEYIGCRSLLAQLRPDVIYTQFGPHWPAAQTRHVVGCAYSNLLYPEIDFWGKLPFLQRTVRKLVDVERTRRLMTADHIIFETEDLAQRAIKFLQRTPEQISCVRPSVSSLIGLETEHFATRVRCEAIPSGFRVLLLSVLHPNKNIELLPEIAVELRDRHHLSDVVFVLTLPPNHPGTLQIFEKARRLGVLNQLHNLGPIPQEGCAEAYRACQAVILPSQLESFSNNIAEAWTMRKPLLITDMDWSRSLCGEGAVYFSYNSAKHAATQLVRLKTDTQLYQRVVECGHDVLASYPTSEQRFQQYLTIIERCRL